jgi:transcriptional regulator NrdR family protein
MTRPSNSGLTCPKCGAATLRVEGTRRKTDSIMRNRLCTSCKRKFVTIEKAAGK